jgi:hypothetical protein
MEAMIHARFQPQRRIGAVAIVLDRIPVAQQILKRVWKSLGLKQSGASDAAAGADDRISWTHQNVLVALDRTGVILEFANKTIVKTFELGFLGVAEIEIGE